MPSEGSHSADSSGQSEQDKQKAWATSRQYDTTVAGALRLVWEATDRLCSNRLHPFLPELVTILRRHGESTLTAEIEAQLCKISPSTIDRLLRPYRRLGGRHPFTTTKPGSLLKSSIPIHTFADWQEDCPGFLEVDMVSHCGESNEGFYLTTLCTVDVAQWLVGVYWSMGKGTGVCRCCHPRDTASSTFTSAWLGLR